MPGAPGGVPERPKGTGCKPVGSAYGGSNPPAPTVFPAHGTPRISALALSVIAASGHGKARTRDEPLLVAGRAKSTSPEPAQQVG